MARDKSLNIKVRATGTRKATKQVRGLSGAFKGLAASAGTALAPIIALGAAFVAVRSALRVGAEFEQSMANLKAVSGATTSEFKALEKMAKDLGGSTKFTASEVAGLGTEFAKLGFTSKEIQAVSNDTLALAAAVGSELPRAAEVAGATLRGFGIQASDTQRVTNLMAASFSGSALDMSKFAESMKFVAPVAAAAGFEIEGTTAMLATLANVGIHGSMAGTALKNVFIKLADESSALSKKFGGPITSIEELAPALQKLKDEGMGLSEALALTDKRSAPAFLALVKGSGDLATLTEAFTGTNAAQEMMAIQLDTLSGRTDILKSATQAFAIELFDTSEGPLKRIVEGLTKLMVAATDVTKALRKIDFSETFMNMANNFSALLQVFIDIFKVYVDLIPDLFMTAFKKILPIAKGILTRLLDGVKFLGTIIWEPIKVGLQIVAIKIQNVFIGMFNFLKEQFNNLSGLLSSIGVDIQPLEMTKILDLEGLSLANTTLGEFFKGMGEDKVQTVDQAATAIADIWAKYGESVIATNENLKENLGTDEEGNVKTPVTTTPEQVEEQAELIQGITDSWVNSTGEIVRQNDAQRKAIKNQRNEFLKNMQVIGKEFPAAEKVAKRFAQVQATVDAYASATAAYKAMAGIPVVGPALGIAAAAAALAAGLANVRQIERAATGMDEIVNRPTMILAGEAGAERVSVTPLEGPNINGPQGGTVNITFSGNVMSQDFIENEAIPQIKEAIRRGADLGVA